MAGILVGVLLLSVALVGAFALSGRKQQAASDTGYDVAASTSAQDSTEESTQDSDRPTTTDGGQTFTTEPDATTSRADQPGTDRATRTSTRTQPRTSTQPAGRQKVFTLADNPLFTMDNGIPATPCTLARWTTDPAGAQRFFTSALPCLEAAWKPVLQRAGLPYYSPKLAFPSGSSWSSPCGSRTKDNAAAFYCGQDATLYLPFDGLQTQLYGAHPGVYLAVFAHEFGHHIQWVTGIGDAYWDQRYNAGADSPAGLELSRRLELEAQCFSGEFFAGAYRNGSVDDNILREGFESEDRGDHLPDQPHDHGSDAHYESWWAQGAQRNRTGECNTWGVSADRVS